MEYLIPVKAANFAPLRPLRSNSSSSCSRRAAAVLRRPSPSVLIMEVVSVEVRAVIVLCYDISDSFNRGGRGDAYAETDAERDRNGRSIAFVRHERQFA